MKFKRLLAMFLIIATLFSLSCTFASAAEDPVEALSISEEVVQEDNELAPEDALVVQEEPDISLSPEDVTPNPIATEEVLTEETQQETLTSEEPQPEEIEPTEVASEVNEEPVEVEDEGSLLDIIPEESEEALRKAEQPMGQRFTCEVLGSYDFAQRLNETHFTNRGRWTERTGMHKINGQWAYCLSPFEGTGEIKYEQNNGVAAWAELTPDQKTAVSLALAYGYPNYKFEGYTATPSESTYYRTEFQKVAATQCIIWEIILGSRNATAPYACTDNYIKTCFGSHTVFDKVYVDIAERLKNHDKIPSFTSPYEISAPAIPMQYDPSIKAYKGTATDTNNVLPGYNFAKNSTANIQITQSGNKLTVIAKNKADSGFTPSATGEYIGTEQIPVMAWSPSVSGQQPLCTMAGADPTPIYFKLGEMTEDGTCEITKTTDSGSAEGFKMKLYRFETNHSEYGISDSTGKVHVTNASFERLSPDTTEFKNLGDGKYAFKEYATKDTYPDLIEISVRSVDGVVTPIGSFGPDQITLDTTDALGDAYGVPTFEVTGLTEGGTLIIRVHNSHVEIGTTATNAENGSHTIDVLDTVTINDVITYSGLVPGKEYTVSGILMDKETEEPIQVNGENVIAATIFTPNSANGRVTNTFTFSSLALAGKTVVVYESLYRDGVEIYTHADINDENQTVVFAEPEISTIATNKEDESKLFDALDEVTLTDTVSYSGLAVGKEYTLVGTIMSKDTGEALKVNDAVIMVEKSFTPTATSGTVDVDFTFSAAGLQGQKLVIFETLYYGAAEITSHADLNDEDQTVQIVSPEIQTKAINPENETNIIDPISEIVIVDRVAYENVIPGKNYIVYGILMDKETEEPVLVDGEPVVAQTPLTPMEASGTVEVVFIFDATGMNGKTLVVFETLLRENFELAVHADIEDEAQTIYVNEPDVGTTATFSDGSKMYTLKNDAKNPVTVRDVIAYTNLQPGATYVAKGILMDAKTGEELLINNEPVRKDVEFTPEEKDGEVVIEFNFDASDMENGASVVVFEEVYRVRSYENDIGAVIFMEDLIAEHKDITDKGQTVSFTVIPKTGDTSPWVYGGIALGCVLVAAALFIVLIKIRKKNR